MGLQKRINFGQVKHNLLTGRNEPDAHSISSVTGLQGALDFKGNAFFKRGSGTFPSGQTSYTVNDSFITSDTLVTILPTGAKKGNWTVDSNAGNFTITSSNTETSAVTFDWGALK